MILTLSPSGASSFPLFVIISSRAHRHARQALLSPHRIFISYSRNRTGSLFQALLRLPHRSSTAHTDCHAISSLSSLTSHRSCEKIPVPILKLPWWRRSSRSGLEANSRAYAPFLETSLYSSGNYCQMADGKAIRRRRATAWPWIYNAIDCLPGPKYQ
jgi:hypothetical protein